MACARLWGLEAMIFPLHTLPFREHAALTVAWEWLEGKNARKEGENSWTRFCILTASSLGWMWFLVSSSGLCKWCMTSAWAALLFFFFPPGASRLWDAKRSALRGGADMMKCKFWKSLLVIVGRKKMFNQGQGIRLGLEYVGLHDYWVLLINNSSAVWWK